MSRGPIVVMALEREDAIQKYRDVIGATDPAKAAAGTLRKLFGANVGENALHGSDSPETAKVEIAYFFAGYELRPLVSDKRGEGVRAGRHREGTERGDDAVLSEGRQ